MKRFALLTALFAATSFVTADTSYGQYYARRPAARAAGAAIRGTERAAGAAVRGTERVAGAAARTALPPYGPGYGPRPYYGPRYYGPRPYYGARPIGPGAYVGRAVRPIWY
ncbi:MAG TPA: hypothetical protein VFI31_16390 [Pirellulales bacterium]|nr:hypothetical protein [Pirellulales bacterium]